MGVGAQMISCKDVREPASASQREAGTRTYKLRSPFNGRRRADLYMYVVVVKSSRSLSHLLMSSCANTNRFSKFCRRQTQQ